MSEVYFKSTLLMHSCPLWVSSWLIITEHNCLSWWPVRQDILVFLKWQVGFLVFCSLKIHWWGYSQSHNINFIILIRAEGHCYFEVTRKLETGLEMGFELTFYYTSVTQIGQIKMHSEKLLIETWEINLKLPLPRDWYIECLMGWCKEAQQNLSPVAKKLFENLHAGPIHVNSWKDLDLSIITCTSQRCALGAPSLTTFT